MSIVIVPQLSDNYAYLVIDEKLKLCAVVDCSEPGKVLKEVESRGLKLESVLTTHWHADHSGGNAELNSLTPGIKVFGGADESSKIPAITNPVSDGDVVRVGNLNAKVIAIPAHTGGHVAYYFEALSAVFTGDTLFSGGCGRMFEGDAATMLSSLKRLASLPADTKVYCGHEYTKNNLEFALTLEPNNEALREHYAWAKQKRANNEPTIPSTIGIEREINPFLRSQSTELKGNIKKMDASLDTDDPVVVFGKTRELKDTF